MNNEPTIGASTSVPSTGDVFAQFRTKKELFTPANGISFLRVLLVIPAVLAIVNARGGLAAGIFVFAYFTDLLDGFVARKTNDVSEYGKIIDPLADKIFVGSIIVAMLVCGLVPLWFVVVVLARDLVILLAGIWAGRKFSVVLPSNYPGKAAVLSISLTLFLTVLGLSHTVLVFLEGLSVGLMAVSLFQYGARLFRLLKSSNSARVS